METSNPTEYLTDPLSELARKERRNLLIASTVGILVSQGGLIPSKITALGIELSPLDQDTFIILVALTVYYFVNAFAAYGFSDFLIWRNKYQEYLVSVAREIDNWSEEDQKYHDELQERVPDIGWIYSASRPLAYVRIGFDFVAPLAFSGYALVTLGIKLWNP